MYNFPSVCIVCLQDSVATQITTVPVPVSIKSSQDTSALVSGNNLMSKQPSLQGRLYALTDSAHPTEDTETANPLQKPLVIIDICITVNNFSTHTLTHPHLHSHPQASSANQILLNEESGH